MGLGRISQPSSVRLKTPAVHESCAVMSCTSLSKRLCRDLVNTRAPQLSPLVSAPIFLMNPSNPPRTPGDHQGARAAATPRRGP
eukprot:11223508-Lingulodinium_polyedra.AAC.1